MTPSSPTKSMYLGSAEGIGEAQIPDLGRHCGGTTATRGEDGSKQETFAWRNSFGDSGLVVLAAGLDRARILAMSSSPSGWPGALTGAGLVLGDLLNRNEPARVKQDHQQLLRRLS